jgi:hypothetical protein
LGEYGAADDQARASSQTKPAMTGALLGSPTRRKTMTNENETDEGVCAFPICEGASDCFADDDTTGILWRAHEKEASRLGAKLWNYGWATTANGIVSKTSIGYLESHIEPTTMKVAHRLSEY